jgi:uncharacterized repeat protein (TIGR01451 family)
LSVSSVIKKIPVLILAFILIIPTLAFSALNSAPVKAASGPDLIVQEIALSPSQPAIDNTVTITVTVKNQGSAQAGQNYLVCYADSTILATVTINPVEAGTMTTATFTWRSTAGTHTFKAIVDSTEMVTESDETNNSKTYTITTRAADLIVQSITWLPSVPSRGDTVTFSVTIKNQGNAATSATNADFFIDNASRGAQDIPALDPSATTMITYTWTALFGQHTIKAAADVVNNVKESNESNNELTVTYTTAAPDLIIDKITWSPLNPSKGDSMSVNATVKNQGQGRADACHIAYFIDGELKTTIPVNALETNTSVNITFAWTVTADKHQVRTVIDYFQNVSESDESNNEKSATISSLLPDLTVSSITWAPVNAAVGDTVSINATIKNLGGGRSEKAHVMFTIDNAVLATPELTAIDGTSQTILNFTWKATGGSHSIGIILDPDRLIEESSKDNNTLYVTIAVIPPDLEIPVITWAPVNFAIGDTVTFTVNVTNSGGGLATNFDVAFFIDGLPLAQNFIGQLNSSSSMNLTCNWKATSGRHFFKAFADDTANIIEGNETNNTNSVTIAPNMPDLAIYNVTWSPADITAGTEITFNIDIKNAGTLSAGASRTAFYIDGTAAGFTDIGQLDASAVTTIHFKWNALDGQHNIKIIADSENKLPEIDEANNTKIIGIPPADLTVPGMTWTPENASTGEKVTITATIKNRGSGPSQPAQISCYVDDNLFTTKDIGAINAGDTMTVNFDWTTAAGGHKIKVTADASNAVAESDETNNSKEVSFGTLTPDLFIPNMTWSMQNPLTDDKADFVIFIKNQGTGTAGAARLAYSIDGGTSIIANIPQLDAGATANWSFSSYLKAGAHTVNAAIDSNLKISELDETNNNKILAFSTIVPDLNITTISLSPATALTGDNVTITVKVENRGRDKATNAVMSLTIDGTAAGSASIPEIALGGMASYDFSWKATAGTHQITAAINTANSIPESNYTNNSRSRAITIEKAAASTPTVKPTNIKSSTPAKKSFIDTSWWLILLAAGLLGGGALYAMIRANKKG